MEITVLLTSDVHTADFVFFTEAGEGGGEPSEGARVARRCDGKVAETLSSLRFPFLSGGDC